MKLLLVLLLLIGGCSREVVDPSPVSTVVLQAQTRRAQVVAEIARINQALRFIRNTDTRIVLEGQLNERRVELDRLNALIGGY